MTNNVFGKNIKTQQHKANPKNPCQSRKSNSGPVAPQSNTLPLDHQVTERID